MARAVWRQSSLQHKGQIKFWKFPLGLKIKGVLKGTLVIQQNLWNSQECFEAHTCGL